MAVVRSLSLVLVLIGHVGLADLCLGEFCLCLDTCNAVTPVGSSDGQIAVLRLVTVLALGLHLDPTLVAAVQGIQLCKSENTKNNGQQCSFNYPFRVDDTALHLPFICSSESSNSSDWAFSTCLCGLLLLGRATIPCWISQRSITCASVFPVSAATFFSVASP